MRQRLVTVAGVTVAIVLVAFVVDVVRGSTGGSEATASSSRGGVGASDLMLLQVEADGGPLIAVVGTGGAPGSGAVVVPNPVLFTIPGQGEGSAREAASLAGPQSATAFANLLGAPIDHYGVIDLATLAAVVDRAGGIEVDGQPMNGQAVIAALDTKVGRPDVWASVLEGLLASRVTWASEDLSEADDESAVAAQLSSAGKATAEVIATQESSGGQLVPQEVDLAGQVARLFGYPNQVPTPVIVLNGSGVPGVGEPVAARLVPGGFRITESENASSFDHERTLVVAATEEDLPSAERIRELLGVGVISVSGVPSGLGDVTIVVGKDLESG